MIILENIYEEEDFEPLDIFLQKINRDGDLIGSTLDAKLKNYYDNIYDLSSSFCFYRMEQIQRDRKNKYGKLSRKDRESIIGYPIVFQRPEFISLIIPQVKKIKRKYTLGAVPKIFFPVSTSKGSVYLSFSNAKVVFAITSHVCDRIGQRVFDGDFDKDMVLVDFLLNLANFTKRDNFGRVLSTTSYKKGVFYSSGESNDIYFTHSKGVCLGHLYKTSLNHIVFFLKTFITYDMLKKHQTAIVNKFKYMLCSQQYYDEMKEKGDLEILEKIEELDMIDEIDEDFINNIRKLKKEKELEEKPKKLSSKRRRRLRRQTS